MTIGFKIYLWILRSLYILHSILLVFAIGSPGAGFQLLCNIVMIIASQLLFNEQKIGFYIMGCVALVKGFGMILTSGDLIIGLMAAFIGSVLPMLIVYAFMARRWDWFD